MDSTCDTPLNTHRSERILSARSNRVLTARSLTTHISGFSPNTDREQSLMAELEKLKDEVVDYQQQEKHSRKIAQHSIAERDAAVTCQGIAMATCKGAVTAKKEMWNKLIQEKRARQSHSIQLITAQKEVERLNRALEESKKNEEVANKKTQQLMEDLQRQKQETQTAKNHIDTLNERVDALKDELLSTEKALAEADEKLHSAVCDTDRMTSVQIDAKRQVTEEQAMRRRAELQVQEAVSEVASATKDKQLAEMQAEDAQRLLELEVKLRAQLSTEKDQVVQQLLEEQDTAANLERQLMETEAALTAAAEEVTALRALECGSERERDENMQAVMDQLHERVCQAESGRKVAEAEWYNVERMRREALEARDEAERNWSQVSAILEKEQEAQKRVLQELLEERSARLLAQKTLSNVANVAPPLTARTSNDVTASLLVDRREEVRGLCFVRSALADVHDSQAAVLSDIQDLQNALGLLSFDSSSQAQAVEAARVKADQASRLAILMSHRADEVLGAVKDQNAAMLRQLEAVPRTGGGYSNGHRPTEDVCGEDSVFPDTFTGLMDDLLDSNNDSEELYSEDRGQYPRHEQDGFSTESSEYSLTGEPAVHSSAPDAGEQGGGDRGADENSPLTVNSLGGQTVAGPKHRPVNVPRLALEGSGAMLGAGMKAVAQRRAESGRSSPGQHE